MVLGEADWSVDIDDIDDIIIGGKWQRTILASFCWETSSLGEEHEVSLFHYVSIVIISL